MTTTAERSANALDGAPGVDAIVDAASPPSILITSQEVVFATAAAVSAPSPTTPWWTRAIHAVNAAASGMVRPSTADSRPARRDYPRRYTYLENALMSREMDRL